MNPKTTLTPNAPRSKTWRSFLPLLMVAALPGLGTKLQAQGHQTDTWSGLGADNGWGTAANWNQPVTTLGDDLIFTGTTRSSPSNSFVGLGISSITINGQGFTIGGNALTITNGIIDTVGSNTISIPLTIGANQTFANNTASGVTPTNVTTISGAIVLGTNNLTLAGSGNLFLTGGVTSTSTTNGGTITIANSGVARFGTTGSAFGGNVLDAVIVSSGELQINNGTSVPFGPSIGNILDNGIIDLNGFSPTFNGLEGGGVVDNIPTNLTGIYTLSLGAGNSNAVWSGSINNTVGSIAVTKTGFGTETFAGPNGYSGLTQISQGTLAVVPGGSLGSRSLSMIISPGGVLDVTALGITGYNPQGIFNLNAGTPSKPYTNFLGSYSTNYLNFVITTNITLTATNITTNSIVSVINSDVNGNFYLFGGSFTPVAPSPGYATFTVNGNLTLDNSQGGVNNLFFLLNNVTNAGGGLNDLIQITNGTMNIGDTVNFVISPANGTLATGKYTLIQSPGLNLGGGDFNGSGPAVMNVIAPRGITGVLDTTSQPGNVLLTAGGTAAPATITWAGTSAANNNWDIHVTQDWKLGGSPDFFFSGDSVVFNDGAFSTINLPSPVTPTSMTFNNNTTNYVFTPTSGAFISGTGGLTLNGTGSVTLNTPNSFTGNTVINNGTLTIGEYGSFANITLYNGVAPGQIIFGANGLLNLNYTINNVSALLNIAGFTLNSGANAEITSLGTRGANDLPEMTVGANIVRNVGSSLYLAFGLKASTVNNGIYFTNTIPWTNGLLLGGWAHGGSDWITAATNLGAASPASGNYNYTGYSNNAALAVWLPTNNMSVSNSTFALTASATVNTLKLVSPATVNITAGQTLKIQTGGLLVSSTSAGAGIINGGTIEGSAGGNDLIVLQNETSSAFTIASVIADNGSPTALTLGGLGGTLILSNNNSYTGPTYINAGSLQVGGGSAVGSIATSSAIFDNGFLSFNRPDATSVSGAVSGLGGITQLGTGALTLTANNTLKGVITVSAGTLQLGNGGAAGSVSNAVNLVDNGSLVFDNSGTVGYPNAISGIGNLVQFGSGTLVIGTNETYFGTTTVSNGTVLLTAAGALPNTLSINVNAGATFDASAAGGLTLRSTAPSEILSGSGTVNGSVTTAAGTTVYPGGNGTVGTLSVNNNLSLNGGNYVFDVGNASHDKILVGGTLNENSGVVIFQLSGSPVANGLYPLIVATGGITGSAGNVALANFIQPGQIAVLTNSTPNELDLLVITGVEPTITWLGDGSANVWDQTASSKWLDTNGNPVLYANGDFTIFNDTGSTNPAVNLNATLFPTSVTVNSTNHSYTLGVATGSGANKISGGASLIKNGPGTLVLNTINDYIGGTTINGGVVQLNGTGVATSDGMIGGNGTVVNNGTLIANNSSAETIAGNISGNGLLVQQGVGPLILAGNNTAFAGPITFSNVLQVGNGVTGTAGTGPITNNGVLVFNPAGNITVSGNVSGPGAITNIGGTVTLSGNNTYAGVTAVAGGTLRVGSVAAIPPTTTLVLNDNTNTAGIFDLNGQNLTVGLLVGTNGGAGTANLATSEIINGGSGTSTLVISGPVTNVFYGQINDNNTLGSSKVALAFLNGASYTLSAVANSASVLAVSAFSGGVTVSNATLTLGVDIGGSTIQTGAGVSSSAAGTGPYVLAGTNATLQCGNGLGNGTATTPLTLGSLTVPTGSTANILAPKRGTFNPTTLLGGGTIHYQVPNLQRTIFGGNLTGFTGSIIFSSVSGGQPITFAATAIAGLPSANVIMQLTNTSGTVTLNTVNSGSVFPIGSLSGGDNSSALCGAASSGGNGGQPTAFAIGGLNTSTTFGGIIEDVNVGIRKVGTGTLTLTNANLPYTGQTIVSNGVLAIVPALNATNLTPNAQSTTFLVGSNFTLASPGILDVTASGGTLYLGRPAVVQSIFGNGTLNGNLQVTNGIVEPGRLATQTPFFTGNNLQINGSVIEWTACTNIFTINRTNATPNDSLTASSITYGGVLIVTNLGDTAFPGQTTNTFHLFNGTISGSFASVTLPTLAAGEYWITNLNVGTISIANTNSAISNTPTPIVASVTGGALHLSWAPDHLGWWLQAQTNTLGKGLGTNWVDIAGSNTSTNSNITPDPAQPTVFYRLSQLP